MKLSLFRTSDVGCELNPDIEVWKWKISTQFDSAKCAGDLFNGHAEQGVSQFQFLYLFESSPQCCSRAGGRGAFVNGISLLY